MAIASKLRRPVAMTVNGQRVEAEVEPRTHLADFLRESQGLTGTNLGCDALAVDGHGDGAPQFRCYGHGSPSRSTRSARRFVSS